VQRYREKQFCAGKAAVYSSSSAVICSRWWQSARICLSANAALAGISPKDWAIPAGRERPYSLGTRSRGTMGGTGRYGVPSDGRRPHKLSIGQTEGFKTDRERGGWAPARSEVVAWSACDGGAAPAQTHESSNKTTRFRHANLSWKRVCLPVSKLERSNDDAPPGSNLRPHGIRLRHTYGRLL